MADNIVDDDFTAFDSGLSEYTSAESNVVENSTDGADTSENENEDFFDAFEDAVEPNFDDDTGGVTPSIDNAKIAEDISMETKVDLFNGTGSEEGGTINQQSTQEDKLDPFSAFNNVPIEPQQPIETPIDNVVNEPMISTATDGEEQAAEVGGSGVETIQPTQIQEEENTDPLSAFNDIPKEQDLVLSNEGENIVQPNLICPDSQEGNENINTSDDFLFSGFGTGETTEPEEAATSHETSVEDVKRINNNGDEDTEHVNKNVVDSQDTEGSSSNIPPPSDDILSGFGSAEMLTQTVESSVNNRPSDFIEDTDLEEKVVSSEEDTPSSNNENLDTMDILPPILTDLEDISALDGMPWTPGSTIGEGENGSSGSENNGADLLSTAFDSLGVQDVPSSTDDNNDDCYCYLFAGSASPRHNKVWVYTIPYTTNSDVKSWVNLPLLSIGEPRYHGCLLGHQDWITCFSWLNDFDNTNNENEQNAQGGGGGDRRKESLLASSGHDAKIRLWKFTSYTSSSSSALKDDTIPELLKSEEEEESGGSEVDENSDDDEANIDDLEEEEGEARLIINHHSAESSSATTPTTTAVSLEALLLGHEEAVTSLTWRHQSKGGRDKPCLLSSSMDRTILLWMEEANDGDAAVAATGIAASGGVWVPISRVGSAGGIVSGELLLLFLVHLDVHKLTLIASLTVGWIDWCLAHGICRC